MKSNINLVSISQIESEKGERSLGILKIASIVCVALVAILSISLFIISQALSPEPIKRQEEGVISQITGLRPKQAKLILVVSKAKDIGTLIQSREKYDELLTLTLDQIPEGVSIGSLELDSAKVSLSVTSKSLLSVDQVINNLYSIISKKEMIKNFKIESISADPRTGSYSMSVTGERI